MNKEVKEIKEIKENLDFAREVFDYTLNPNQCGLLLDYINQLENKRLKEDLQEYKRERLIQDAIKRTGV